MFLLQLMSLHYCISAANGANLAYPRHTYSTGATIEEGSSTPDKMVSGLSIYCEEDQDEEMWAVPVQEKGPHLPEELAWLASLIKTFLCVRVQCTEHLRKQWVSNLIDSWTNTKNRHLSLSPFGTVRTTFLLMHMNLISLLSYYANCIYIQQDCPITLYWNVLMHMLHVYMQIGDVLWDILPTAILMYYTYIHVGPASSPTNLSLVCDSSSVVVSF